MRGVSPHLSRQAVISCVLPIVHFGAETWWPGASKNVGNKKVSNRVGQHLEKLDKVHRAAARAILPAFRTTPSALLREAGLPTAEISLNNISLRAAVRTRKLDPRHPLSRPGQKSLQTTVLKRFSRAYINVPASDQLNPLLLPSWEILDSEKDILYRIGGPTGTNSSRAEKFRDFLLTIPPSDTLIYSDGSKLPDGSAGG